MFTKSVSADRGMMGQPRMFGARGQLTSRGSLGGGATASATARAVAALVASGRKGRIPAHYTDAGWFRDRARTQPWVYPQDLEQQVQWVDDLTGNPVGWQLGADLLGGAGDMSSATGWTLGPGVSITGGVAVFDSSNNGGGLNLRRTVAGITPGKLYRVTFRVPAVTSVSGGVSIRVGTASTTTLPTAASTGWYTADCLAVDSGGVDVLKRGAGAWAGTIDNITVQEVIRDESWLGANMVSNSDNEAACFASSAQRGTITQSNERAQTGSFSAKYTCTNAAATNADHFVTALNPVPAGKQVVIEGWYYLPSGSFNALNINDGTDGSFFNPSMTVKDAWTYFRVVRGNKATNWSLFIGAAAQTSSVGFSYFLDNITVREIPGNPLVSPSAGNGPVATARVNLLQRTEEFDNAAWSKSGSTVTQNAGTAPGGALTADKLVESTNNGAHQVSQTVTMPSGATRFTVRAKAAERSVLDIELTDNTTGSIGYRFNLLAVSAVVTGSGSGSSWTSVSGSIQSLGDGWCLCTIIGTRGAGTQTVPVMRINNGSSASYLGDGTSGILVWGADLRLSVYDSLNLPAYQRVGDGSAGVFDYDWQGFPVRLVRGAANRGLMTLGTLDLTGTDAVNAGMWVVKTSDAAAAALMDLSNNPNSTNGSLTILAPSAAAPSYGWYSRGTTQAGVAPTGFAAPHMAALLGDAKISTPLARLTVNGTVAAQTSGTQGTGNYGNHRLYEGGRSLDSSPSLSFTGEWLPGFVVDANAIDATLAAAMLREMAARVGHIY